MNQLMHFSIQPNPAVTYEIRYADDDLLVVDKPPRVSTQPGRKNETTSLLSGLFVEFGNQLQNMGADRSWGLLHRLDKDTSGLVIVALRPRAYENLVEQFKQRQVKKLYWAIVAGRPTPAQGVIQKPIAETAGLRKKAVLRRDGRPSITAYRVLQSVRTASGESVSLIEARPKTGRLHQIRVHMASLGHPILGETEYQGRAKLPPVPRLCLHAAGISFIHPSTSKRIGVTSPWPEDLCRISRKLGLPIPDHVA